MEYQEVIMIIDYYKEKAFNAITFFLQKTSLCNKKKLYKLLFLFDFEHFEQTGRNVTGYDYFAWRMGPVPTELHEAIDSEEESFLERFRVHKTQDKRGHETVTLQSKKEFEEKYFTRRELRILNSLAERFELMNGDEMESFTHREGTPWYRVWVEEERKQKQIPYEYALDGLESEEKEVILNMAQDRQAFIENYK